MKKKIPLHMQPDSMDCGATCLKMICSFYGKEYHIETLRKLCHMAIDGVSLMEVSKAAEEIGFKTIGGRIKTIKLIDKAILPCILHWNQEHFVVLYKINRIKRLKRTYFFL